MGSICGKHARVQEIGRRGSMGRTGEAEPFTQNGGVRQGDYEEEGSASRSNGLALVAPPTPPRISRTPSVDLGIPTAVRIPAYDYELNYSYATKRGHYPDDPEKENQDSFFVHTPFGDDPNDHFFGVFDGHGQWGGLCSQFASVTVCQNLIRDPDFYRDLYRAHENAFELTNSQLHRHSIDDRMSGTTAVTVFIRGTVLYVSNVGDSRAVIAENRDGRLIAVDLSNDQTPYREDESERVKSYGARVLTLDQLEGKRDPNIKCWGGEGDDDGDPPRVWGSTGTTPGTAFTRSIGDSQAEDVGVIGTPEILVQQLTPQHSFIIIASDGVFEFLSSQEVVDIVSQFDNPQEACQALVTESFQLWLRYEPRTDDITVIVIHINGLRHLGDSVNINDGNTMTCGETLLTSHTAGNDRPGARISINELLLDQCSISGKSLEELEHIERALQGNFLFHKLTKTQLKMLYGCVEKLEVTAGDVVMRQGEEGNCFYIVQEGEFEVFICEEGAETKETQMTMQNYSAKKLSCFGELALMYNKPSQASVRATTDGSLWALKREDFRGILLTELSDLFMLNVLQSVRILPKFTILQLKSLASSFAEVSFKNGEKIFSESEKLSSFYVILEGEVELTYQTDSELSSLEILPYGNQWEESDDKKKVLRKRKGEYFGEWVLLGQQVSSVSAVAIGDVLCSMTTKEKFDLIADPIQKTNMARGL